MMTRTSLGYKEAEPDFMASVDNEIYNRPGDIWWDENEMLSVLRHALNPVRLGLLRPRHASRRS